MCIVNSIGGKFLFENLLISFRLNQILRTNFYSRIFPTSSLRTSNQSMNSGLVLSATMKTCIRCAGISGILAMCLGVYGSHIMKDNTPDELRRVCLENVLSYLICSILVISIGSNVSFISFSGLTCCTIGLTTSDYRTFVHWWNFTFLWSNVLSCYTK